MLILGEPEFRMQKNVKIFTTWCTQLRLIWFRQVFTVNKRRKLWVICLLMRFYGTIIQMESDRRRRSTCIMALICTISKVHEVIIKISAFNFGYIGCIERWWSITWTWTKRVFWRLQLNIHHRNYSEFMWDLFFIFIGASDTYSMTFWLFFCCYFWAH